MLITLVSCLVHQIFTFPSSLPETSLVGSVLEKSTLHALFSCSSYSITLCMETEGSEKERQGLCKRWEFQLLGKFLHPRQSQSPHNHCWQSVISHTCSNLDNSILIWWTFQLQGNERLPFHSPPGKIGGHLESGIKDWRSKGFSLCYIQKLLFSWKLQQ